MINIGGNPLMIILAIVAALGGVGLYFVRNFRPELARDHDIFFSAIALVYGIILLAFNFRMEITTQLAQVLLVGFAGWFAVESLVLRQALSNQARRTPMNPIADDPIRPDYRVELDTGREISPRRSSSSTRRMRGTSPSQPRPTELRGDIDNERRSRRPKRSSADLGTDAIIDIDEDDIRPVSQKPKRPRPSGSDRPSSNRPNSDRPSSDRPRSRDDYRDSSQDDWTDNPPPKRRRSSPKPAINDVESTDQEDY